MSQPQPEWRLEHSVDCRADARFAWNFWTTVGNWALDADVESIEIDGPFAAGAQGVTNSKSSGRIEWRIAEAAPGKAVIEFPLPGAVGRSAWTFDQTAEGCRMSQRFTLEGDQAETYARAIGPALSAGIPAGMRKLCEAIEKAASEPFAEARP